MKECTYMGAIFAMLTKLSKETYQMGNVSCPSGHASKTLPRFLIDSGRSYPRLCSAKVYNQKVQLRRSANFLKQIYLPFLIWQDDKGI